MDALRVSDLGVARGDRSLFNGLFFELRSGEALSLTGANGSGKTSLLRSLAGFIRPASGQIDFASGSEILEPEEARKGGIHLLGHLEGLKPTRTARQELIFQCDYLGGNASTMASAIERLELSALLDLETRRLSAGQKRRLSMARLLSAPRPLWLLDEPLAPLDAVWRQKIADLMSEHLAGGGMMIAAVHDPLPFATRALDVGDFA